MHNGAYQRKETSFDEFGDDGELSGALFCTDCGSLNEVGAKVCKSCHAVLTEQGNDLSARLRRISRRCSTAYTSDDTYFREWTDKSTTQRNVPAEKIVVETSTESHSQSPVSKYTQQSDQRLARLKRISHRDNLFYTQSYSEWIDDNHQPLVVFKLWKLKVPLGEADQLPPLAVVMLCVFLWLIFGLATILILGLRLI